MANSLFQQNSLMSCDGPLGEWGIQKALDDGEKKKKSEILEINKDFLYCVIKLVF